MNGTYTLAQMMNIARELHTKGRSSDAKTIERAVVILREQAPTDRIYKHG